MNWKKFLFAFIAAFVFLFVFGFLWYGTLMHGAHREVPTLLRPEADFKSYFGWLALGQFVMAFFFYRAVCSPPSGRTRRCRSDARDSGGISVCRAAFDLIRSPTITV